MRDLAGAGPGDVLQCGAETGDRRVTVFRPFPVEPFLMRAEARDARAKLLLDFAMDRGGKHGAWRRRVA